MKAGVQNRLKQIRTSKDVSVISLASYANVTRQTIHAIEARLYVPNTKIALLLARYLKGDGGELFLLSDSAERS
jgi:DNA-binding XRE family transcriptional regulator